jgi:hypothetical protein
MFSYRGEVPMKKLVSILIGLLIIGSILTLAIDRDVMSISKYVNSPGKGRDTFETTLTAGHYTAGIDIPPGTYSITSISGTGQVSSTKVFSGAIDGKGSDNSENLKTTIDNVQLPENVVLTLTCSLVAKISTDTADLKAMIPRINTAINPITLTPGQYKSGQDFDPGTYDVIWVSGLGTVSSSNLFDQGIFERMGFADLTAKEFKNLELKDGSTLTVSDLTIQLVPSK